MALQAQNISYSYARDQSVLRHVTLNIDKGQILYLLGHNGSGKTTLLSCVSGILKPTAGQVILDGVDIQQYSPGERACRIGLIPQLHIAVFAYTVREMVMMGRAPHLGLFGAPGRKDYEIVDQAIDSVGLAAMRDRVYTELSGGERQLVMIARGLAQQCDYLLMDEPDAHLDPSNQQHILEIVAGLAGQGLSFVIASHAPNCALLYADQVFLLKKGQTLAYGDIEDTLTEPLLTEAYGVSTEVIYRSMNGKWFPRAILPRRSTVPEDVEMITIRPDSLMQPDSILERVFEEGKREPQLLLVTGESGSGKSSWCADIIMQVQRRGMTVGGVLSPSVVKNGRKIGIDLIDLGTGQRRRLAGLRHNSDAAFTTHLWAFDNDTMQWGNAALESVDCDVLIVDELGPLELNHQKGLMNIFCAIDRRAYKVAFVVVRPSLMDQALLRWPGAYVIDVDNI